MSAGGRERLRRLVFWQPIVSPHQRDFLEAVAAAFDGEVVLAAERGLPAERIAMGWPPVVHRLVRVVDAAAPEAFEGLVGFDRRDTLHVFSGFFSHPVVWRAFRRLVPSAARLAMLSEAPEQTVATGWLKRWRGRILVDRFAPRLEFALVMGGVGRRFFEAVGFPARKIVTFGYYLPAAADPDGGESGGAAGPVHFLAAGQFIRRKGFDLLVDALAGLPDGDWRCTIRGAGPLRARLERRARRGAARGRVTLPEPAPNEVLLGELAGADWAVVPSRHDGWGMIVNEALGVGTPVVCTDGCGAADLLDDPAAGVVVPAGDAGALGEALWRCLAGGKIGAGRRRAVRAIARRHDPSGAAATFLELVGAGG